MSHLILIPVAAWPVAAWAFVSFAIAGVQRKRPLPPTRHRRRVRVDDLA